MTVLVTGAAGFIGYHVARRLAERGEHVIGLDDLPEDAGREVRRRRLVQLATFPNFSFRKADLTNRPALDEALAGEAIRAVIHLAARPNRRGPVDDPQSYLDANLRAHLNLLEHCRFRGAIENFVYASSSAVYGQSDALPFVEDGDTSRPVSVYGATKRAAELMSEVYAEQFRMPQVGLRLFSVYGPWGRPDMITWIVTEAILRGTPVRLFGDGAMLRDFTYVDDAVTAILAAGDRPVAATGVPHRIYNVARGEPVAIIDLVGLLEALLGRAALIERLPMLSGEVMVAYADTALAEAELGFTARTPLAEGLRRFVDWYRRYLAR
jgi:UDP-glucuronate 4-epimerase